MNAEGPSPLLLECVVFKIIPNTAPLKQRRYPYDYYGYLWSGAARMTLKGLNVSFASQVIMNREHFDSLREAYHKMRNEEGSWCDVKYPGDEGSTAYPSREGCDMNAFWTNVCASTSKELIEMDYAALAGKSHTDKEPLSHDIYAVVLLRNKEYAGHIFAWVITTVCGEKCCQFIGIRARWDNMLLGSDRLRGTASYLLEGVRQLALHCGAVRMFVYNPVGCMPEILVRKGFRRLRIVQEKRYACRKTKRGAAPFMNETECYSGCSYATRTPDVPMCDGMLRTYLVLY